MAVETAEKVVVALVALTVMAPVVLPVASVPASAATPVLRPVCRPVSPVAVAVVVLLVTVSVRHGLAALGPGRISRLIRSTFGTPTCLLACLVTIGLGSGACVDTGNSTAQNAHRSLRAAAESTGRLFGAALNSGYLGSDAIYTQTAGSEFDYVTPEWKMKWDPTETSPGNFNFTAADTVVDFAVAHGMQIKGHTLVWVYSLPAWVSQLTTADDVRAAMNNHIQGVVGLYAGRVKAWDVVNEALTDTTPTTYSNNVFYNLLGETYIDEAFVAARAADPDALLFYNESNIDWGVTDGHSWLNNTSTWSWAGQGPHDPLLFNADDSKKPAYSGTLVALLGQ